MRGCWKLKDWAACKDARIIMQMKTIEVIMSSVVKSVAGCNLPCWAQPFSVSRLGGEVKVTARVGHRGVQWES